MSSSQTRTEFLEGFLDLRLPQQSYVKWRRERRIMSVCFFLILVGNVGMIVYAESFREVVFPTAQIVFWTIVICSYVGQELAYDADVDDRTPGFARKLRVVSTIAVMAFFPFLLAAIGGQVSSSRGTDWLSGVLVGGGAGLVAVVLVLIFLLYHYRRRND